MSGQKVVGEKSGRMLSAQTLTKNEVSTQTVPLYVDVRGSTPNTQVQALAPFNANTLQIAIGAWKRPGRQGASCSCCLHDVCTLCIVAFILCRRKNNSVNSPSAPPPTASISSHSHSQSVLNVSHALSLSLSRCVFAFASVRP